MCVKKILINSLALLLATAIWLPSIRFFYSPNVANIVSADGMPRIAQQLVANQVDLWNNDERRNAETGRIRASNGEWDFMARSFLVWSLAESCLRDPGLTKAYLPIIDRIIDETLMLESQQGFRHFLLAYANHKPFLASPASSHFVDGEIALMLASRRIVSDRADYRSLLEERVRDLVQRIESSPLLCPESYPDECWMFDQCIGLAALALGDRLDGTDHSGLFGRWVAIAKIKLTDVETGLLVSRFDFNGNAMEGPEGSSIWMVAHCLRLIDEGFARDQYAKARRELGRVWLGFGFAREWPATWRTFADIDSGVVLPGLDASPAASGLAFIGAASFGDTAYLEALHTSLAYGGFPVCEDDRLRYAASNQVGDAVVLYASTLGPIWHWAKTNQPNE